MLARLGGAEFLPRLASDLAREAAAALAELDGAVRSADILRFRDALHSTRSGVANFGALRLHAFCGTFAGLTQDELKEHGVDYVRALASELEMLQSELSARIRARRRSQAG